MDQFFNWPPRWSTLLLLPALFVAFTVHELAHALVAFLLGDTSQVERKRLSFNPLRHVSWLGMLAFLVVGLGWAKPVLVDHQRLRVRNRAFGLFLVSVAGATANFAAALLALAGMSVTVSMVWMTTGAEPLDILRFMMTSQPQLDLQGAVVALGYNMMMVNLLLGFFNLLPLPPLDGFQAVMSLFVMVREAFQRKGQAGRAPALPGRQPRVEGREVEQDTDQSPAHIHFDIGLGYHREGKLDEAIARYRQAIAHDENLDLAYYNLGLAYWAKGRRPLAVSSFRAAARSSTEVGVRIQADLRLHELAGLEQAAEAEARPLPPPLELGHTPTPADDGAPPLDPAVARRVWLRLGLGAVLLLTLAVTMWLFVTGVTMEAMM